VPVWLYLLFERQHKPISLEARREKRWKVKLSLEIYFMGSWSDAITYEALLKVHWIYLWMHDPCRPYLLMKYFSIK
jgi:hypothetical protein